MLTNIPGYPRIGSQRELKKAGENYWAGKISLERLELTSRQLRKENWTGLTGPGVYDIHSPRVPAVAEMEALLHKAAKLLPLRNIWVNPDCGLKTRKWAETEMALRNMVTAAKNVRLSMSN